MSRDERFNAVDALLALLCLILVSVPVGLSNPSFEELLLASVAIYPAAALLAVALRRRSLGALLAPGRFNPAKLVFTILGTVGITVTLLSLIGPIMNLFPESRDELETMDRELRSLHPGLAWVLIAVLAPIGEEIFFRAALLRGFRSTLGTWAGLVLSSAFFAFFHGLAPRMIVTFAVGLWLGALYLKGRGLALCVTAHMLNNAVVLALMFGGTESVPLWWGPVGAASFLAGALGLRFSRQGSPPPATS